MGIRSIVAAAVAAALLTGCVLTPDPPPQLPREAFGGMGDRMAECMGYASQSYCENKIWGGGEV